MTKKIISELDVLIGQKVWIRKKRQKDQKNIPSFENSCTQLDLFEDEDRILRCFEKVKK